MEGDVRRIVLVGFMAAGKSTVAPILAQALGWRVLDVDAEIVSRTGKSIDALFRTEGEPAFRKMESELTDRLSSGDPVVVAPGGGWIGNPGSLYIRKDPGTRLVWLRISLSEALKRARADQVARPLLAGTTEEAEEKAGQLLAKRESLYAEADHVVDVDGKSANEVTDDILEWLKQNIS